MGEAGFGILMAVWGAGMALGALVVAPRFKLGAMACAAVAAVGAQGLGIAVPALWPMVWLAIAGFLFGGVAHGTKNVLARTLIHERAPERVQGRAFAAFNGLRNGAELVALTLGGVAITTLGARWTLLYAGGVPVIAARRSTFSGRALPFNARRCRSPAAPQSPRTTSPSPFTVADTGASSIRTWNSPLVVPSASSASPSSDGDSLHRTV